MRLDAVGGEILFAVVRGMAHKGIVILQSQLFGRSVQTEINRERSLSKLLGIHHLQIAFRDLLMVYHTVEYHMRHQIRDYPFAGNILTGLQFDTVHPVVPDIDPADFCVVPNISAQFPDPGVKGHGDLMAAIFGKPGQMRQINISHIGVNGKAHVRGIGGDIGPVRFKDAFCFFRDADPVQHLFRGDRHNAHQVIIFQQHLHLGRRRGLVVVGGQPVDAVVEHAPQLQHSRHGLPAAGNLTLHFIDECLYTRGHGDIEAVRVCRYGTKRFMGCAPLHVQLVGILQKLSYGAAGTAFFPVAHLAKLMERCLKFVIAATEAGGTTAGQVVLFQHKHFLPGSCQIGCRRQASVAGADNNDIVFLHVLLLYVSDFSGTTISRIINSFPLRTVFSKLPQLGQ